MEAMDTGFDDLLHKAEQLTADIDGVSEMPRINRNLRQLLEAGEQLWSRTSASASRQTNDVRASVLLGSKGYDLQKVSQQLESLSSAKKLTPIESIAETDIKSFLRSERENAIIKIIDDIRKSTIERADKLFLDGLQREWDEEKSKILNALVGPEESIIDYTSFDINSSIRSQPISPSTPKPRLYLEPTLIDTSTISAMTATELAFAKEVIRYVDKVVYGTVRSNIANIFYTKVAKESVGESLIIDLWEMVTTIVSNEIPVSSDSDPLLNRCDPKLNIFLIKQSKLFLEKKFIQTMQSMVNPSLIQTMSQTQSLYKLIKDYLIIKSPYLTNSSLNVSFGSTHISGNSEDGLVDGIPIWCFIWHCLRAGCVEAAIEVAQKGSFWEYSKDFIAILREYRQSEDRRLSQKTENQIKVWYKKSIRLSNDLYKKTVFSMLGSCGINDFHSEVLDKVDDFLWLRLSQIQVFDNQLEGDDSFMSTASHSTTTSSADRLTFGKLKKQISEEYGESYFDAKNQPFMYFRALFLTNQFESAIEFLFRIDSYRSHAIHIAIVLNEMGLLIIPPYHLKVPLLSKQVNDPSGVQRLNFAKLIHIYTRKFETNNSIEAIYYYYLLRNIRTASGEDMFTTSVSQLVRESKNYEELLGRIDENGVRIHGAIDKFNNNVMAIIDKVATDLEDSGKFEEAVKLYDLGSKHTKVLQLLNKMLSPVVSERKVPDSKRTRLETLALKLAERYYTQENKASPEVSQTFYLLIDLMTFFDYFHNQQNNDALDTITKLNILPFRTEDIEMKVNQFSRYTEEIRRNIPHILLASMSILYSQYKDIKSSTPRTVNKFGKFSDSSNREQFCNEIRQKARALITYAGMIPYRMPGDSNARLVQLEVMMN